MNKVKIVQDIDQSILVMQNVSEWMQRSGIPVSEWWKLENMNRDFLLQHTEPNEYYVAMVNGKPAASVILEDSERNQSWEYIDGTKPQKALYVHWLCVAREFASQGYSKVMIDFAEQEAKERGFKLLRLDTNAKEKKLCSLYESLGFKLLDVEKEGDHLRAYYQKELN